MSFFVFTDQQTLNRLPQSILDITTLVVYEDEMDLYLSNWGEVVDVISSPPGIKGLPARRQWVYETFGDGRIIVQLDDDLRFGMSSEQLTSPYMSGKSSNTATDEMIQAKWDEQVKFFHTASAHGFPVGSFFPKVAPLTYKDYPCVMNRRIMSAFWIDTSKVDLSGIDFVGAPAAEDFYLHCQLMTMGIPNVQSSIITLDNFVTGNDGGLSGIRDEKMHNDSMEFVHNKYPDATKIKYGTGALGSNVAKLTINSKKLFSDNLEELTAAFHKLYEATAGETKANRTIEYKTRQTNRK